MKTSDLETQKRFFADQRNQYSPDLILRPPYHTAREIEAVLRALRTQPATGEVADFGAGTGRLTVPLLRDDFAVCAVDAAEEPLARLRELAAGIPGGSLRTATELPESGEFAAVVGTDVLHHIPMETYLPRIREALAPGGRVVFSEPGAFNPTWWILLTLIGWEEEKGFLNCSVRNLTRVFTRHGFRDLTITGLGLLPRPFFNPLPRLCDANDRAGNAPLLRRAAYRYIVAARRA